MHNCRMQFGAASATDPRPWMRRASPLARLAWLAYALLILYAGLAPWSGWRDLGVFPLAFITAPVPRYLTRFDLIVNVLAFVPLGALGVLALHPRLRAPFAVLAATVVGAALSALIEALQTYLPARVPSNIDWATNSGGVLAGALVVAPWAEAIIDRGRLAQLRARWFARDATLPLLVLALWPAAQIYPGAMLFGNGESREFWSALAATLPWPGSIVNDTAFGPAEFVLAEAIVVAAGLFAAGLAAVSLMPSGAPRGRLLLALVGAALLVRLLAWGVQFKPEAATAWITPGAVGGLLLGGLALAAAATGPPRVAGRIAVLAVLVLLVAVNVTPENPYHADWLGAWRPGRWVHASAAAHWLAVAWPYMLLAILLVRELRLLRR